MAGHWSLAERVIRERGSLSSLIDMSKAEIRSIFAEEHDAAEAFLAVRETLRGALFESVARASLCPTDDKFLKYLLTLMAHRRSEVLLAFYADRDGGFIAQETLVESDGHEVRVSPRAILAKAVRQEAEQVLLVHNHPSGDCRPSKTDIEDTRRIEKQAGHLGIKLVDHLIVGGSSVFSIKQGRRFNPRPLDDGPDRQV